MDLIRAIKERKSIRNFKTDPIPKSIIRQILEISCKAPSAVNTQPWEFTVISGDVLEAVRSAMIKKFRAGEPPKSGHSFVEWPSDSRYRVRQVELAKQIFKLMDIPREDPKKRTQWTERGFKFFNAPAAIIISMDRMLEKGFPVFDIGAVAQTICLTALDYGIGTCIEDQGVMYPQVLREFCNIPDTKQIIIAIAIGYPDWQFPANRLESPRESIDAITAWFGFEPHL